VSALGLREILLALIVLVVAYMLWLIVRMRGLSRAKKTAAEEAPTFHEPRLTPEVATTSPGHAAPESVDRQISETQEEVDMLRGVVSRLRKDMAALREELVQEIAEAKHLPSVSPLYGEATQMALMGYEASVIAERCGIARAEADLVLSLVKNKDRA
jgi:TolA-binding protein